MTAPSSKAPQSPRRRPLRGAASEVRSLVPPRLRAAHDLVCSRAQATGAEALILTGSTARATRTSISDLDYHVVGVPIPHGDLPAELDIHVVSPMVFRARIEEGDDFTQWSLRFGRVISDRGIVQESRRLIEQGKLWPDVNRKADQAAKSLKIARMMVQSGDQDAAVEQVRTALTLVARWQLLADGVFPLSRGELPAQLKERHQSVLAAGLDATIIGLPTLEDLSQSLDVAQCLVERGAPRTAPSLRPHAA